MLENVIWVGISGHFNANDDRSDQNPLDHTVAAVPFIASEGAETMDELFHGTEDIRERTCAAV